MTVYFILVFYKSIVKQALPIKLHPFLEPTSTMRVKFLAHGNKEGLYKSEAVSLPTTPHRPSNICMFGYDCQSNVLIKRI